MPLTEDEQKLEEQIQYHSDAENHHKRSKKRLEALRPTAPPEPVDDAIAELATAAPTMESARARLADRVAADDLVEADRVARAADQE